LLHQHRGLPPAASTRRQGQVLAVQLHRLAFSNQVHVSECLKRDRDREYMYMQPRKKSGEGLLVLRTFPTRHLCFDKLSLRLQSASPCSWDQSKGREQRMQRAAVLSGILLPEENIRASMCPSCPTSLLLPHPSHSLQRGCLRLCSPSRSRQRYRQPGISRLLCSPLVFSTCLCGLGKESQLAILLLRSSICPSIIRETCC
jgi:hypothetical protein